MSPKLEHQNQQKLNQQKNLEKSVSFEYYAPFAEEVCLSGEFNQWNSMAAKMKQDQDGNWRISLKLAPGRYEYRFLVDGNWENDPKVAEYVPNAFGTWNCVFEVQ